MEEELSALVFWQVGAAGIAAQHTRQMLRYALMDGNGIPV